MAQQHCYFYGRTTHACRHDPTAVTHGSLYFLSNFCRAPFVINGRRYATVEHYYQRSKFHKTNPAHAERIRLAKTPTIAKRLGSQAGARRDWDDVRVHKMRKAIRAKFDNSAELRQRLLDTGTALLYEDAPNDAFWGAAGLDQLGLLLMSVREEIRSEQAVETVHVQ